MLGDQHSAARLEADRLYRERGGEYSGGITRPRAANWRPENGPSFPCLTVGPEPMEPGDTEDGGGQDGDGGIW
jgi:hypothetical protein